MPTKDYVRSRMSNRKVPMISKEHRASIVKRAVIQTAAQFPRPFLESVKVDFFTQDQFSQMLDALELVYPRLEIEKVNRIFNVSQNAVRDLIAMRACVDAKLDRDNLERLHFVIQALYSVWNEVMSDERLRASFNIRAMMQHHFKRDLSSAEICSQHKANSLNKATIEAILKEVNSGASDHSYFSEANTMIMNTLGHTGAVVAGLRASLSDTRLRKAPEYRFASRIAEGWHIATGRFPTVTRDEEKAYRTPFQRFIDAATPPPHVGSEVIRNVIDRMKLERVALVEGAKKSAPKNPKKGSPRTP